MSDQSPGLFTAAVVTVSDGVYHGSRQDRSGSVLVSELHQNNFPVVFGVVVPDVSEQIVAKLQQLANMAALVLTTGGTGFGPRDVTPEATAQVVDRPAPGLVHLMLSEGIQVTPMAALSRPQAGSVGQSLIVNLPGSPKGAIENLRAILPVLPHCLQLLSGDTEH